ncbi:MAG: DNA primase [Gammaproteobacteria bacterium]
MAGRIPTHFIDELLNRTDIVEVIDARVPLKKAGHEYKACCPFHNEKTPSFTVSQSKQFYHCFGCGAHGTAVGFLMEYDHMGFPEAVEELARAAGLQVPREDDGRPPVPKKTHDELYQLLDSCDRYYRQQLRKHPRAQLAVDYLKGRGMSGEVAARYGVGYAPPGWDNLLTELGKDDATREQLLKVGMLIQKDNGDFYDRFRNRIMFPIRDSRGRTIGFGGRVISPDDTPKYLNSPETPLFHKGQELYGLYEAKKALRKIERLLVVEGYMDVVALAQFGIAYAVATLGTATTREHLQRLFRLTGEVVFCFDGDRAGREAAWRAVENALPIMRAGYQLRFMFLPEGEDPDSQIRKIGAEAFAAQMAEAAPFSSFFFNHLQQQIDISSLDGRAQLVEKARPLLAQLPEGVFRDMMVEELARLAQRPAAALEQHLKATTPAPTAPTPVPAAVHRPRPGPAAKSTPSLVGQAIFILLNEPGLGLLHQIPSRLQQQNIPGMPMLAEILDTIAQDPAISAASLVNRLEQSGHARHLPRLLQKERLLADSDHLASELEGILQRLAKEASNLRFEELRQRADQLNADELNEFRDLMRQLG